MSGARRGRFPDRWGLLLIAQGLAVAAAVIWGVWSWRQARADHDRYVLPTVCPQGHQPLDLVKIAYGPAPLPPLAVTTDSQVLQVDGGVARTPDSPAFLVRCTTCGWTCDGWSFATLAEALKEYPELDHLAEPEAPRGRQP